MVDGWGAAGRGGGSVLGVVTGRAGCANAAVNEDGGVGGDHTGAGNLS